MYVQNNYFGVGSIPKQKPNLADTFRQYQNHIAKDESSLSSKKVGKDEVFLKKEKAWVSEKKNRLQNRYWN